MAGPNRLARETSPYLRQHRDNPVDWYPWGDEAFAAARERDVPILLSVGYSSCHWCHVMAHESFEDPDTAAVMNAHFVNVKVDREERPDVDGIYMQAVQAMTGRGGWPMTVFLTPDGVPFYGGTYYPNVEGRGMPSFRQVMAAISDVWRNQRDKVLEQGAQLQGAIEESTLLGGRRDAVLGPEILEQAYQNVRQQFDPQWGGFGGAPKFPQAMTIDFLCRAHVRNQSPDTLEMITTSLDAMAAGGMYDQLGGGFARYSVDRYWLVPHFEKMLYDQALLVRAYTHAWMLVQGTPTGERYARVVAETVEYVLRDLTHAEGGFYSAEDADSEGVEGKFYVWSQSEIEEVCGADAAEAIRYWGVTPDGNFEDPHRPDAGRNSILHVVDRTEPRPAAVERARAALLARRATRVRPGLDDKVLLGWNALFLAALAEAAAAFDRADWLDAARRNARFLLRELRRASDGRLLRSWQADAEPDPDTGRARHLAYAEDHAALLEALLTLAEVDDVAWLAEARSVAAELVRRFHDPEGGGFFTTGSDAEALIVRPKDVMDNATPSENSLAANGLLRLAALTGESEPAEHAEAILRAVGPLLGQHPTAFAYLLGALERWLTPPLEVAIVGPVDDARTAALRREVEARLLPASVHVVAAAGDGIATPLLASRDLVDGAPTAFVCEHYACRQPVTDAAALRAQLDAVLAAR